jgi:hypothetical protein
MIVYANFACHSAFPFSGDAQVFPLLKIKSIFRHIAYTLRGKDR